MLGGPLGGLIAAAFLSISPFVDRTATLILSDPLGALLTVLILIALIRRTRIWFIVAGLAAGALIDVRLLGALALLAAFIAAPRRSRWVVLACSLPFIAVLAYYQWHTFGSPLKTGYSYWLPGLHQFGLGYITGHPYGTDGSLIYGHGANTLVGEVCGCNPMRGLSNLVFYPTVLSGVIWIFGPPLTGLIGLAALIWWRDTPAARYALAVIILNVAVLLVYFYQGARLIAPAGSLLLVYSAAGIARCLAWALERVSPRTAGRRLQLSRG